MLRVCYNGKESEVNMVTKGWCENCQFQNRNGVLYCSQCGEELQNKQQPDTKIMFVGLAIAVAWLLFLALWLFSYASGFSSAQNLGIFILSLVVVGILEALLTVPFARRQAPQQLKRT
jgi:Ca2+/Na+ antiporter